MYTFFLHFFPLFTIFLGFWALFDFVMYMNSLQQIEHHMKTRRREDWEKLGRPGIFSGKFTEKAETLRAYEDATEAEDGHDGVLESLFVRSNRKRQRLTWVLWCGLGMFFFTIFAVRYLNQQIAGLG